MRIPTTESRRGLDTGAGSLRTPRVDDTVGQAIGSVGGQISALGDHFTRQQEASQAMGARRDFLEFQNTLQQDYRQTMENVPETGAGLYDGWFVGNESEPGLFDQRATEFIASLPENLQPEYQVRLTEMRGDYDDTIARDELGLRQRFAGTVIERQVEASTLTIGQNPATFEDQLHDVQELVLQSGLPPAQAAPIMRAAEQQLALSTAQAGIQSDPDGWARRVDSFLGGVSEQGGDPVSVLVEQIVQVESGGSATARNPRSSATGAGQFISSTWMQFVQEDRPDLAEGRSRAQILALRNDPNISRDAVAWYARANETMLRGAGLSVTPGNLYLAHFAGPEGARNLLRASPSASAETILGSDVVRANPFLRGRSVQWAINWAAEKMEDAPAFVGSDDPVLSRIEPSQIAALRSTAQDAVVEQRRMSDYDATVFEQTVEDSLASIRETGRPVDGLNDDDVLRALGEEGFAEYDRDRQGATLYHQATRGMESLPSGEIDARIAGIAATPGAPGFELVQGVREEVQEYADTLRVERLEDPAVAVQRIPQMREVEDNLDLNDSASVASYISENMRWQSVLGIPFEAREPVPKAWSRTLADQILETQADAQRSGIRPADAMQASIDSILAVFGDEHAEAVTMAALGRMTGSEDLANVAMSLFRQMRRGDRVRPATTAQADDAIDMSTIDQGLEPFDPGAMP